LLKEEFLCFFFNLIAQIRKNLFSSLKQKQFLQTINEKGIEKNNLTDY